MPFTKLLWSRELTWTKATQDLLKHLGLKRTYRNRPNHTFSLSFLTNTVLVGRFRKSGFTLL